jgi:hypothetical protein
MTAVQISSAVLIADRPTGAGRQRVATPEHVDDLRTTAAGATGRLVTAAT